MLEETEALVLHHIWGGFIQIEVRYFKPYTLEDSSSDLNVFRGIEP